MIDTGLLKPLILANESYIRRNVVEYFDEGWIRDADIVRLVLEACERYGYGENGLLLVYAARQPIDAEALRLIYKQLQTAHSIDTLDHLNELLQWAPLDLLKGYLAKTSRGAGILETTADYIEERLRCADRASDDLFSDLLQLCKEAIGGSVDDTVRAEALVETLGERSDPSEKEILEALMPESEEDWWTPVFLTDLAGARKLTGAIPTIVSFLGDEDIGLNESAMKALARIGDPEAARLIGELFPQRDWEFQNFAVDVLGRLKHRETERVILSLRDTKSEDSEAQMRLCHSLCRHFSPQAIEWAREMIECKADRWFCDLREDVLTIAKIHGIEVPGTDGWHEDIERLRAELGRRLEEAERDWNATDEDPDDDVDDDLEYEEFESFDDDDDFVPPEPYVPPEPPQTYRRPDRKIGRNEPCPCGSGKKYKKCCGRPET